MVRAILFDVDGTLYRQGPVRMAMALELALLPVLRHGSTEAQAIWRILGTFRRVREELREAALSGAALEELQYTAVAERCAVEAARVRALVHEWMLERPLPYLRPARRAGAAAALGALARAGLRIGVFSDYPTAAKISALGLQEHITLQLCATDRAVNAFKPRPDGFLMACERWELRPEEVVYVGDRPEVDATGAAAAGMRAIVLAAKPPTSTVPFTPLRSFGRLPHVIASMNSRASVLTTA